MEKNEALHSRLEAAEAVKASVALLRAELDISNGLLAWHRSNEASWNAEISRMRDAAAVAEVSGRNREEEARVVRELHAQVTGHRLSRSARIASFFKREDTLWEWVAPAFQEIKSYTGGHFRRSSRTRLVLGADLAATQYREYAIAFPVDTLGKVSLAIHPFLHGTEGAAGVEIVCHEKVVAQVTVPLANVHRDSPANFVFPAGIRDLSPPWLLRVFVRDVKVPVAIWELMECSALGRGIDYRLSFCSGRVSLCLAQAEHLAEIREMAFPAPSGRKSDRNVSNRARIFSSAPRSCSSNFRFSFGLRSSFWMYSRAPTLSASSIRS